MQIKNILFLICVFVLIFSGCKNKKNAPKIFSTNIEYQIFDDFGNLKYIANYNKNILFHVDAVQGFGKARIYPKKMNIDLMSVSGHKIHGPKGVGALFKRKGVQLPNNGVALLFFYVFRNIKGITACTTASTVCNTHKRGL